MAPLTEDELLRLAAQRGWLLAPERVSVVLPEVRRLLDAAARLRDLPIDPAAPPDGPA